MNTDPIVTQEEIDAEVRLMEKMGDDAWWTAFLEEMALAD